MARYGRPNFKALRLSEDELDKLLRISAITAHPGDFSKTVRYLIETHPEPEELGKPELIKQALSDKRMREREYERGYNQGYAKALDELSKWISRAAKEMKKE